MRPPEGAACWLRAVARIVPEEERADWTAEWRGELAALRRSGAAPFRRWSFAAGALPHALTLRLSGLGGAGFGGDLRLAARTLVRNPGFALVATVTLALGVAVNGALFALVDGLLMRPPEGVAQPERLVQLARSYDSDPRWDNFSRPAVRALADADGLFEGVAGYTGRVFLVGRGADSEFVSGAYVTGDYFPVLGVRPALGRLLDPGDDGAGAEAVAVLGHTLWRRRFGADSGVVGRTLDIGGAAHRIVGVAPRGFTGVDKLGGAPEVFVPTAALPPVGTSGLDPGSEWGFSWLDVVARLRVGVEADGARAALDGVSLALREASPQNGDLRVRMAEGVGLSPAERTEARRLAALLGVVAGLVLLLTSANVAGLFLARAMDRRPEMALRRTLGAGRGRVVRQMLTESVLLAGVATILAIPLLEAAGSRLGNLVPATVSIGFTPGPRTYAAVLGLGVVAGLLFGAIPAVVSAGRAPGATLGSRRTSTGGRTARRIRGGLVVGQLAVSLGLLAGAGLLLRSVQAALDARPGLDPSGVIAASIDLDLTGRYDDPTTRRAFLRALLGALEADPAVDAAALSSITPFWGPFARMTRRPSDGGADREFEADLVFADPDWFELYDVPVLRGRGFTGDEGEPVALVNESLARLFWPEGDAVGRRLEGSPPIRVVGVVADVRSRSLRVAPNPAVYEPVHQAPGGRWMIQIRPRPGTDAADVTAVLRRSVAGLDPGLPVARVVSVMDRMAATLGETRKLGTVVSGFALLSLLLAALGLYAALSYTVARRTRELAVRAAIGARPGVLFGGVVRGGMTLTAVGAGMGLLVAVGLGRALESTLYGVGAVDGTTLAVGLAVVLGVAFLATAIPARRAVRLDPAAALREDL